MSNASDMSDGDDFLMDDSGMLYTKFVIVIKRP